MKTILILIFSLFLTSLIEAKEITKLQTPKKTTLISLIDWDGNELLSERGELDNDGIAKSSCKIILKWFDTAKSFILIKEGKDYYYQIDKIYKCNIKKDYAYFSLKKVELLKKPVEVKLKRDTLYSEDITQSNQLQDINLLIDEAIRNQKQKKYDKAIEYYKKVISLKPDHVEALISLGICYFSLSKYKESIDAYQKALLYSGDYKHEILSKIATSYFGIGNYEKAIESYRKALELSPNNPEIHFSLGLAFYVNGKKEEAFQQYVSLRRLDLRLAEELFDILYR
ncbi:MAG: tetratricopeptide repeat protein [Thermodesulfovibrionales bacterium]|nr:tetratricopeptide repeat protein [Thermodesulfovibrionales bacterium]